MMVCSACERTVAGESARLHVNVDGCNLAWLTAYEGPVGLVWGYADATAWEKAKRNHQAPLAPMLRWLLGRQPGQRNNAINWAAYNSGVAVARGLIGADDAYEQILRVALALGDDSASWESEVRCTIKSGLNAGMLTEPESSVTIESGETHTPCLYP